jgi:hypothetical protein
MPSDSLIASRCGGALNVWNSQLWQSRIAGPKRQQAQIARAETGGSTVMCLAVMTGIPYRLQVHNRKTRVPLPECNP